MSKSFPLIVTAAFVLDGEIVRPDDMVEVSKAEAQNLLGRGRARQPTEKEMEEAGLLQPATEPVTPAESKPAKAEKASKADKASKAG